MLDGFSDPEDASYVLTFETEVRDGLKLPMSGSGLWNLAEIYDPQGCTGERAAALVLSVWRLQIAATFIKLERAVNEAED